MIMSSEENPYFREVKRESINNLSVTWWHVEIYDDQGRQFPVGVAYVKQFGPLDAQLDFIVIADAWRRQGFAERLMHAIKSRWPNAYATQAMSEEGQRLLDKCGWLIDTDED